MLRLFDISTIAFHQAAKASTFIQTAVAHRHHLRVLQSVQSALSLPHALYAVASAAGTPALLFTQLHLRAKPKSLPARTTALHTNIITTCTAPLRRDISLVAILNNFRCRGSVCAFRIEDRVLTGRTRFPHEFTDITNHHRVLFVFWLGSDVHGPHALTIGTYRDERCGWLCEKTKCATEC